MRSTACCPRNHTESGLLVPKMDSATRPSWTADLRPCGIYYEGFVTDLEGGLQKHHVDTVSTFSIRKSCQTVAGKQQAKIELDSENQVNQLCNRVT